MLSVIIILFLFVFVVATDQAGPNNDRRAAYVAPSRSCSLRARGPHPP